ncbi:hypothetical protein EVAR_13466_1 [Eumeta japonica]|uniref:Uncharacterized protein n=1 Tax=Eumeta variegata TaxID=151549 RepID=A0A4C1UZA7_EUMVA|nr:hypothetical protein EVAR_13466_1 [Eumeta japonica]
MSLRIKPKEEQESRSGQGSKSRAGPRRWGYKDYAVKRGGGSMVKSVCFGLGGTGFDLTTGVLTNDTLNQLKFDETLRASEGTLSCQPRLS